MVRAYEILSVEVRVDMLKASQNFLLRLLNNCKKYRPSFSCVSVYGRMERGRRAGVGDHDDDQKSRSGHDYEQTCQVEHIEL